MAGDRGSLQGLVGRSLPSDKYGAWIVADVRGGLDGRSRLVTADLTGVQWVWTRLLLVMLNEGGEEDREEGGKEGREEEVGRHKEDGMLDTCHAVNAVDVDGNPAGGTVTGVGLSIDWQNGPLGRGANRQEPNGAFVETVIAAARQRLEFYQAGKFACRENALAITKLEEALHWCHARTQRREAQQVEGTHAGD